MERLLARIRRWTIFFMVGLVVSGASAIPIETQLEASVRLLGEDLRAGGAMPEGVAMWLRTLRNGIRSTSARAPYEICKICFWEDDDVQLRDPLVTGANKVSLVDGQCNYSTLGVSESHFRAHVRPPGPRDVRDPGWRPVDVVDDKPDRCLPEGGWAGPWPTDLTQLYWWRSTYWRREA